MLDPSVFTPTELRLYEALAAGIHRTREELRLLLWDELASHSAVSTHLSYMRRKMRPHGLDVVSRHVDGGYKYCMIRLTAKD